jgi:hypothetical protein
VGVLCPVGCIFGWIGHETVGQAASLWTAFFEPFTTDMIVWHHIISNSLAKPGASRRLQILQHTPTCHNVHYVLHRHPAWTFTSGMPTLVGTRWTLYAVILQGCKFNRRMDCSSLQRGLLLCT